MLSPTRAAHRAVDVARHSRRVVAARGYDRLARVRRRVPDGSVALTFDDGPVPGSTEAVLDVLGELGAPATFFCTGANARRHPELIRRILHEGHVIVSHSMTHPHPRDTPLKVLSREYDEGRRAVDDAVGAGTRLFRPPHGHLSARSARLVGRTEVDTWLWTVDPEDWRPRRSTADIVDVVSRAGSGDVVLLHDWVEDPWEPEATDRSATVAALPAIVRNLRARGLTLRTLPT